jgi:P4 family phage/plasmid primase-like protien
MMSKAIEYQLKLSEAARRFVQENPNFLFSREDHTWFSFKGRYWEEAKAQFESITEKIWEEAELLHNCHLKTLRQLCQKAALNKVGMNQKAEMLLNTPTGVVDLNCFLQQDGQSEGEKVQSHEHYQENYLTMMTGASYLPGARLPKMFLAFLDNLCNHDQEMVEYLLSFMAYCLTGKNLYHYLYLLYGLGRNGKSVFLAFMEILLGSYFCKIPSATLSYRNPDDRALREIYRKRGKRMAVLDELPEKYRMNIPLVKQLTGGDSLNVPNRAALHEAFHADFKVIINTNHLPEVGSTQNVGIWERLKVLVTRPPIKPEDRVEDFHLILAEEKDEVLTYILDNYLCKAMNGALKATPPRMGLALEYKKFQENPVDYFIDKTITISNHPLSRAQWIPSRYLYGEYAQFMLNVMKFFIAHLSLAGENECNKLLVPKKGEPTFSSILGRLGGFKKENGGREYWINLYFNSERVWSDNGKKTAPDWLEEEKQQYREMYYGGFTKKRRFEESLTPYTGLKAIAQGKPETHFEEPHPVEDVQFDFNDLAMIQCFLKPSK